MATWAELKERIADEIFRDDLTTQVERYALKAVEHYARKRWWFNEAAPSGVCVPGQAYITPGLILMDTLVVDRVVLIPETLKVITQWRATEVALQPGNPTHFAHVGSQAQLYTTPASAFAWTAEGLLEPTLEDSSENEWTTDFEDAVVNRAKLALCSGITLDEVRAAFATSALGIAEAALDELNALRCGTGSVRKRY